MREINDRFHNLHEQAYTFRLESPIEIVNYHTTTIGMVSKAAIEQVSTSGTGMSKAKKEVRSVVFDDFGTVNTTIYDRDSLPIEKVIQGPAVIEEDSASTVVYPDQQFFRDRYGFLHIEPQDKTPRFGGMRSGSKLGG